MINKLTNTKNSDYSPYFNNKIMKDLKKGIKSNVGNKEM